jgi:ATP-dependent RNA helicase RhlE
MLFTNLGLAEEIVRAVTEHGYTEPTPIQKQAIPAVLAGGDLLAGAQTGTGKTAGFVLPILHRLSDKSVKGPSSVRPPIQALILTPTRELAAQVEESVRAYGKYSRLTSMAMFGGVNINPQIEKLKGRVDILVATPGRLLDHVQQRTLDLSHIRILVLDEADRMLDMGFIRDIKKILALLPKQRQNLLFSATFSNEIKALADGLLNNPALIEVARRNATADNIAQKVYGVDRDNKRQLLAHLIKTQHWYQVLVFTRTKFGANRLAEQLCKEDIPALAIHGNKSQSARTRALAEFKKGDLQVLVATDIAARGIDISELPHVVNYELPNVPEDYVHRIGRTGRAGQEGEAISLVCVDEHDYLTNIERLIRHRLSREVVPGFEPDPNARAQPIQLRSAGRGQPRSQRGSRQERDGPKSTSQPRAFKSTQAKSGTGDGKTGRPATSHRSGGRHR